MQMFQAALAIAACHLGVAAPLRKGLVESRLSTVPATALRARSPQPSKANLALLGSNPLLFAGKDSAKADPVGHHKSGDMVADGTLATIKSIPCLHAYQRGEGVNSKACQQAQAAAAASAAAQAGAAAPATTPPPFCSIQPDEQLNISDYPVWNDPCCNGGGEYFCDPHKVFTPEKQLAFQEDLNQFYSIHPVTCPQLMPYNYHAPNDNYDQRTDRSFRLGVAIARDFSADQADPDSLQAFGLVLLNRWGLQEQYDICPHAAILILLVDLRLAFVASASCEFICKDRGGPEVVNAMLGALDDRGPAAALEAGIKEVGKIVKAQDRYYRASRAARDPRVHQSVEDQITKGEDNWSLYQQIIFYGFVFGAILLVMFCVIIHMIPSAHDMVFGPSGTKKFLQ